MGLFPNRHPILSATELMNYRNLSVNYVFFQKAEAQLAYELQAAKTRQKIRNEEIAIEVVERRKQIEVRLVWNVLILMNIFLARLCNTWRICLYIVYLKV